jgi:hypothetical protein
MLLICSYGNGNDNDDKNDDENSMEKALTYSYNLPRFTSLFHAVRNNDIT